MPAATPDTENPTRIKPRSVLKRRRVLQFHTLEEALAEAARLTELVHGKNSVREDLAGPEVRVVHLANLPLGQMLGHLGLTLSLAVDGTDYRFPPPMRLMMGLLKRRIIHQGLALPVEAPAALNSHIQPQPGLDAASGLRIMQEQFARFAAAKELRPNIMLGRLSREEWIALSCRHCEWHLGFILVR